MSARSLAFTFLACADVKRIWEAIAMPSDPWGSEVSERLAAAEAFAQRFARHCDLLAESPDMGQPRDELVHGLRSSAFERYAVFYRVRGERVEVVRVLRAGLEAGPAAL
jgi:plasmid stabilization system protein ParE